MSDYAPGAVLDFKFSTSKDGTMTTLAGTPVVSVYKDNSTTQSTTGVTLTVDFDGITGSHNVRVDTSDSFYSAGSSFSCIVTAGTVGGTSIVGKVVGGFTIGRGAAYARLGAPAGASVSADVAAVKTQTAAIETDTQDIQARLPAALISGRMDSNTQATAAALTFNLTGNLSGSVGSVAGSVGSVTGAVGSVTGNVGGNVAGSVGSVTGAVGSVTGSIGGNLNGDVIGDVQGAVSEVTGAVGSVTATVAVGTIANNAITANSIAASALNGKGDWNVGKTGYSLTQAFPSNFSSLAINGSGRVDLGLWLGVAPLALSSQLVQASASATITTADKESIADYVWDELLAGHAISGSVGSALSAAGSAGDPWSTLLTAGYAAGTYGYLVKTTIPGLLSGVSITITSPITATGDQITIHPGLDYLFAIGTHIPISFGSLPYSLVGSDTVMRRSSDGSEWPVTITGAMTGYIELTSEESAELKNNYAGELVEFTATLSGGYIVRPLVSTLIIESEHPFPTT